MEMLHPRLVILTSKITLDDAECGAVLKCDDEFIES